MTPTLTTSHTPGPWVVHSGHTVVPAADADKRLGGSIDPDREFERYAKVIHGMGNCDQGSEHPKFYRSRVLRGEAEANARLIAAAPELLAALRQLHDAVVRHGLTEGDGDQWVAAFQHLMTTLRAADAALAKAEGQ